MFTIRKAKKKNVFLKDRVNRTSNLDESDFCFMLFSLIAVRANSRPGLETHFTSLSKSGREGACSYF